MDLNGDILKMILTMLGVKDLAVETDHPQASLTLRFERYGKHQMIRYTLQELIDQVTPRPSAPPPGYMDINDIATPPEDLSG